MGAQKIIGIDIVATRMKLAIDLASAMKSSAVVPTMWPMCAA